MDVIERGGLRARLASGPEDRARVLALRAAAFRRVRGGSDEDAQDAHCRHVMVEGSDGALLVSFRLRMLASGAEVEQSYSAAFYDLAALRSHPRPIAEMGRFCLSDGPVPPDALRLAFGAMTRAVDLAGAGLMIGCSSFPGTDWTRHRAALALLAARHLAPAPLRPQERAPEVVRYARLLKGEAPDHRAALAGLPPLLRMYLTMGGWVSDHAVVDRDLDTLHVFTCVEVDRVPRARVASLRAVAV